MTTAKDDFSDNQTDTWASADVGGTWTTNGASANWDKAGGVGTVVVPAGNGYRAELTTTSVTDAVGLARASYAGADPTEMEIYVILRMTNADLYYCGGIVFDTDGDVHARINDKRGPTGGEEDVLVDTDLGVPYSPGDQWQWQFQAVGTTLRVKAWQIGTNPPAAWSATTTDSTHTVGYVGMRFVNQTGASVTVTVDDFVVNPGEAAILFGGL